MKDLTEIRAIQNTYLLSVVTSWTLPTSMSMPALEQKKRANILALTKYPDKFLLCRVYFQLMRTMNDFQRKACFSLRLFIGSSWCLYLFSLQDFSETAGETTTILAQERGMGATGKRSCTFSPSSPSGPFAPCLPAGPYENKQLTIAT